MLIRILIPRAMTPVHRSSLGRLPYCWTIFKTNSSKAFEGEPSEVDRVPGVLEMKVCAGLNEAMAQTPKFRYEGLEAVENVVAKDSIVSRYLTAF
jgi:hypothetical protein